jgi:hypothetical protein
MSEPVGALAYSEMRDMEKNPYSADEKRVAEYVVKLTGVGAGNDPIGFLLASHAALLEDRDELVAHGIEQALEISPMDNGDNGAKL